MSHLQWCKENALVEGSEEAINHPLGQAHTEKFGGQKILRRAFWARKYFLECPGRCLQTIQSYLETSKNERHWMERGAFHGEG